MRKGRQRSGGKSTPPTPTPAAPTKAPSLAEFGKYPIALRGRQSIATSYDCLTAFGGVGVVARRGWDPNTADLLTRAQEMPGGALRFFAESAPLHLLRLLMEDPTAQMALDNDLTVGYSPGTTRFVAVKDHRSGKGTVDAAGTEELNRLFTLYDPTGGYSKAGVEEAVPTLQRHAAERLNDTGQYFFEAVLGARGEGVTQIVDFDPLTTRYRDDKDTQRRILEQRQKAKKDGWQLMDLFTTFTGSWRASWDNPYGGPRCGAWLRQGLRKTARSRGLNDWLHAVAWPRLIIQFPFEAAVQTAENSLKAEASGGEKSFLRGAGTNGKDLTPHEWAHIQLTRFQEFLETLNSSDLLTIPTGGSVSVASAGNIGGLAEVLKMERVEDAQALLQLLNMLGITDGGTQAYGEVQWDKYALSITSSRSVVNGGLVGIGNLHFRALGEDLVCRVEAKPVRPFDAKSVEETRKLAIENSVELVRMGWANPEEEAVRITGSGVADKARMETYFDAPPPAGTEKVSSQ